MSQDIYNMYNQSYDFEKIFLHPCLIANYFGTDRQSLKTKELCHWHIFHTHILIPCHFSWVLMYWPWPSLPFYNSAFWRIFCRRHNPWTGNPQNHCLFSITMLTDILTIGLRTLEGKYAGTVTTSWLGNLPERGVIDLFKVHKWCHNNPGADDNWPTSETRSENLQKSWISRTAFSPCQNLSQSCFGLTCFGKPP